MKKLLFTLSMVIYLALFSLVSYILTTTCLEYNTSNSIWFMAIYYFIFGIYIIGFIHSGVKAIKKKPKFDRIYITGEDLLKGLGIAIYLGAFTFASYILIRMRSNKRFTFDDDKKETEAERLQREYDEWGSYYANQKQLEDLGNCHRWK